MSVHVSSVNLMVLREAEREKFKVWGGVGHHDRVVHIDWVLPDVLFWDLRV